MKYNTWANLNDEGKEEMGYIFTEGTLPVKSISKSSVNLGKDLINYHEVYLIDIHYLSKDELDQCIEHMQRKRGGHCGQISKRARKQGFIPIRAQYIESAGTDKVSDFI
jgi:hypothetical protein